MDLFKLKKRNGRSLPKEVSETKTTIKVLCRVRNQTDHTTYYRFLTEDEILKIQTYKHMYVKKVRFMFKKQLERAIEEATKIEDQKSMEEY